MSISASSLIALVEARGANEATSQLLEVGAASDTAGTRMKAMAAGGLLVAGAALVGIGVKSTEMAGQFEQSTNLLITSANEVPGNIDLIRKGLLQMSVDTATPVDDLEKGMFNVESASYHGAAAILVEKAAAEGAKVENADLAKVTDVLTTAMHNYNLPASQAVDVMNSFRMAASIGKMRMDDLTGALRNVLPIASQAGVKLTDVEAALSTMSLAGDKGASAGTHLSQMLTYLLAPSSKATSALKEVGLTTQEISDEMKVSLPGTVQMITDAVGEKFPVGSAKYLAALSAIVGGNKSMKAMLELSGISLKTFTDDAAQLAPTMKANSTAVDGWNTVQSNFNFKMQAAKDAVSALMITAGTKLLPVLGKVADAVTPLITDFTKWVGGSNNVCSSMDKLTGFVMTAAGDVKTFVGGISDAVNQSGFFQSALQAASDILPSVGAFLLSVGSDINQNLLPPLESLITTVGSASASFTTWMDKSGNAKALLSDLSGAIRITSQVLGTLIQGTSDLIGWFAQGGVQTQVLAGVVVGLGAAFAAIKIADTVSSFQKLYATWSAGEGILTNLASAVKGKLGAAIDDFLATQAPNLKASMDGIKVSAEEAATAEETVAAAPAEGGAAGWFARLEGSLAGVETQATTTGVAVESIGTDADLAATQVTASTTTMDAELAGVGAGAATASTGVAGLGTAALVAAGPFVVLGAIAVGTYELIANGAMNFDKKVTTSTGETVQANTLRWRQLSAGASATGQQISTSADTMSKNVQGSFNQMNTKSVAAVQTLSANAMTILSKLNQEGSGQMQALDQSGIGYWNDLAAWIADNPINAVINIDENPINSQGKFFSPVQQKTYSKNAYASGTDYAPGGMALVGEHGAELVLGPQTGYLPRGSRVIPNDQIMHAGSGWGGGGGGYGNQTIIIELDGQKLAEVTGDRHAREVRLRYGRRAF